MKKLLLLLTIGTASCSCYQCKEDPSITEIHSKDVNFKVDGIYYMKEIEIEKCEYFTYGSYNKTRGLTHKGNCKNSIHKQN